MASSALRFSLLLTGGFMLVEAAVGFHTGSLTLLADAGHMLGDAAALGLATWAQRFASRERTAQATFGFRRAEVLAAFVNGLALGTIALWIGVQAVQRLLAPHSLGTGGLLETALLGLAVNVIVAGILHRAATSSVNVRAALWHVLSDLLGSLSAVTAAVLVRFYAMPLADSVLSILVAALILLSGVRIVRDTAIVLLEAAPAELDTHALSETIARTPGVASHHDLHAWRISEGFDAVTVHVVLSPGHHGVSVAREVARRLGDEHGLHHVTVQPEAAPPREIVQLGRSGNR